MNRTHYRLLCAVCLGITLTACGTPQRAQPTNTPSGFPTLAPPPSERPATSTAAALGTARPVGTSLPTVSVGLQAYPIPVIGTGDLEANILKWDGPALLEARYTGSDDFVVQSSRSTPGQPPLLRMLINAIGPYDGVVPLDFEPGQPTSKLMVTAPGPWVLRVLPLASGKTYQLPTTINGKGDNVVLFTDAGMGNMMAIAAGGGSFTVVGFTRGGDRLSLVNEVAPYTGTAAGNPDIWALAVHSSGTWSLNISAK